MYKLFLNSNPPNILTTLLVAVKTDIYIFFRSERDSSYSRCTHRSNSKCVIKFSGKYFICNKTYFNYLYNTISLLRSHLSLRHIVNLF